MWNGMMIKQISPDLNKHFVITNEDDDLSNYKS